MPLFTRTDGTVQGQVTFTKAHAIFQPSDQSHVAWAFDPGLGFDGVNTAMATAGRLYVVRVPIRVPVVVSNILLYITGIGVTLTSGQCKAALYDPSGTLLQTTADQSTSWNSTGLKTMAITATSLSPGIHDVAWWFNGTTGPAPLRGASQSFINDIVGAGTPRMSLADTGRTTTAPSTLGTRTATNTIYWAGLS